MDRTIERPLTWLSIQAWRLAVTAHVGQSDIAGRPYLRHVEAVGRAACQHFRQSDTPELADVALAVGYLHDVLEDRPDLEGEMIQRIPASVLGPVRVLTHPRGEPNRKYWARCAADPIARIVKLCDVLDNMRPDRMARVWAADPDKAERLVRKYADAYRCLMAAPAGTVGG